MLSECQSCRGQLKGGGAEKRGVSPHNATSLLTLGHKLFLHLLSMSDREELTFAVDGYSSPGLLADGEKTPDDAIAWCGAINEEQVLVVKSSICELLRLVHALVEPNDGADPVAVEVREVVVRGMKGVAILNSTFVVRTGEGKELPWRKGMGEVKEG